MKTRVLPLFMVKSDGWYETKHLGERGSSFLTVERGGGESNAHSLHLLSPFGRLASVRLLNNRFHAAMRTNICEGLPCEGLIFQVRLYIDNFIVTDTACRGQTVAVPRLRDQDRCGRRQRCAAWHVLLDVFIATGVSNGRDTRWQVQVAKSVLASYLACPRRLWCATRMNNEVQRSHHETRQIFSAILLWQTTVKAMNIQVHTEQSCQPHFVWIYAISYSSILLYK